MTPDTRAFSPPLIAQHNGATNQLQKALVEVGITRKVRFHDLRHSHCSNLISGAYGRVFSLIETKELAGHSAVATTMRYSHVSEGGVARAVHETAFTL